MRRLMAIAAFALLLAVPVWAQRGGGHVGGFGGHGGFAGGHAGGFAGHSGFGGSHTGHFSGGMRSAPGLSHGSTHSARSGFSRGPFLHNEFSGNRFHDRGFRFRHRGFRNNCFGFGCWGVNSYPWWGYYDPWLWDWWDHDSSYNNEDYDRNLATADEMNQRSLEQQRMLRQEQADGDQDAYSRRSAPRPATADPAPADPIVPATVLVFRDQHKQEIQNYAIVGYTLWNFASHRTEKIPLADLDLAATVQANDDRGVVFRAPAANQAQ